MELVDAGQGAKLWRSRILSGTPGVAHCFTSRIGGQSVGPFDSLNMSAVVGDSEQAVVANRQKIADLMGVEARLMGFHSQVHGCDVIQLADLERDALEGDGFVTSKVGIPVIVGVADCFPLLLATGDGLAVAAVHCGWSGVVADIVRHGVEKTCSAGGTSPDHLVAAIGPGIGSCCFEVGPEVAGQFPTEVIQESTSGRPHVDLAKKIRLDLLKAGVLSDRIDDAATCTCCNQEICFSHRGSGGRTGRMAAMIALRGQRR